MNTVTSLAFISHHIPPSSSAPSSVSSLKSPQQNPHQHQHRRRRNFLKLASSLTISFFILPSPPSPVSSSQQTRWDSEQLCRNCQGRGKQPCSLCDGTGTLSIDDLIVQQDHICPNCEGKGSVKCPTCIGLGLANVNGVLRNGARNGTLRMLKSGSYEILDCSAFPTCDIYGGERRGLP